MHKMQNTPKILSIIGSAMDFLAVFGVGISAYMFIYIFTEDFFERLIGPEEIDEIREVVEIYQTIGNIMFVLMIILLAIFVINLIVNLRLILGRLTEQQAKVAYTYQLFIGIVLILLNTVAGIVYIISGVKGRNEEPDKIETREGI